MTRKFRYLGCVAGVMRWESTAPISWGESRHEVVTCRWDWFWRATA